MSRCQIGQPDAQTLAGREQFPWCHRKRPRLPDTGLGRPQHAQRHTQKAKGAQHRHPRKRIGGMVGARMRGITLAQRRRGRTCGTPEIAGPNWTDGRQTQSQRHGQSPHRRPPAFHHAPYGRYPGPLDPGVSWHRQSAWRPASKSRQFGSARSLLRSARGVEFGVRRLGRTLARGLERALMGLRSPLYHRDNRRRLDHDEGMRPETSLQQISRSAARPSSRPPPSRGSGRA